MRSLLVGMMVFMGCGADATGDGGPDGALVEPACRQDEVRCDGAALQICTFGSEWAVLQVCESAGACSPDGGCSELAPAVVADDASDRIEEAFRDHRRRYGEPAPFHPEQPLPIDDIGAR